VPQRHGHKGASDAPPGCRTGKRFWLARTSPGARFPKTRVPPDTSPRSLEPHRDRCDHRSDQTRSLGPWTNRATPRPAWKNRWFHPFVSRVDRSTECPVPVYAPEEALRFSAEARRSSHNHPLYLLLITTGIRPGGEVVAIRRRDLDLDRGVLHISQSLERPRGGGFSFSTLKTPHSRQPIRLPEEVVRELRALLRQQAEERLRRGLCLDQERCRNPRCPRWHDLDLLFTQGTSGRSTGTTWCSVTSGLSSSGPRYPVSGHTTYDTGTSPGWRPKVSRSRRSRNGPVTAERRLPWTGTRRTCRISRSRRPG
jgi:hypothetical protein